MRALRWLGHLLLDTIKWMVTITVVGLWFGFFAYVGWFAARGTFPDLIPWMQGVLGR